jgi:predicted Fe-Mo cluster-binding NifX family protein
MLIAVATDDGINIASHFGRCGFFSIWQYHDRGEPVNLGVRVNTFTLHAMQNPGYIEGIPKAPSAGEVPGEPAVVPVLYPLESADEDTGEESPNPQSHSHHAVLTGLSDVKVVISAGMGWRAVNDLQANNKEIFITEEPVIAKAVKLYVDGQLDKGEACHDH